MGVRHVNPQQAAKSTAAVAQAFTDWLVAHACEGLAPLESAYALAARYPLQGSGAYAHAVAAAQALVRREMGKSFSAGFLAGLTGWVALPVAIPASMAASLILQARMAAAIALLFGHDPRHPGVHTSILLCLEAGYAPEGMRQVGHKMGQWAAGRALSKLAPVAVLPLNERASVRVLHAVSRGRLAWVARALPVAGAVVAGSADAYSCRRVAREALTLFGPRSQEEA